MTLPQEKKHFKYWHIVTDVSEEWQKHNPEFRKGLIITHPHKLENKGVCIWDGNLGKEFPSAYTLSYIGRVPNNTHDVDLKNELERLAIKNGKKDLWDDAQ